MYKSHSFSLYITQITHPGLHHTLSGCCPDRGGGPHLGVYLVLCSVGFWFEAKHIMSTHSVSSAFYLQLLPTLFIAIK